VKGDQEEEEGGKRKEERGAPAVVCRALASKIFSRALRSFVSRAPRSFVVCEPHSFRVRLGSLGCKEGLGECRKMRS
jgi:hypothetical protein